MKSARCLLFEISITNQTRLPMNFAFQPISWLVHHACQVCVFNPVKDTIGPSLHYFLSPTPCSSSLSPWCRWITWALGVGVGGSQWDWREGDGCAAELQIGSPRLMWRATVFPEVIDMQIASAALAVCVSGWLWHYCPAAWSTPLWKCATDFFGADCLSWITRQSNEPVTAMVTEWGVCDVAWLARRRMRRKSRKKNEIEKKEKK